MANITPPNAIPQEEFEQRLIAVMDQLVISSKINPYQAREIFLLHNDRIVPAEHGRACGACRERVKGRLLPIYNELKAKLNDGKESN